MSNIPISCWERDPAAPWNDIKIYYKYTITLIINGIFYESEEIKDSIIIKRCSLETEEERDFLENDLYMIIENELSDDVRDLDYRIKLINWIY